MHAFCLDFQYAQASFELIRLLSLAGSNFTSFAKLCLGVLYIHSLLLGLMRHRFTHHCLLACMANHIQ